MQDSEQLPFPTGIALQTKEVGDYQESSIHQLMNLQQNGYHVFGIKGQLSSADALFQLDIRKDGRVNIEVNTNHNIKLLSEILNRFANQKVWNTCDTNYVDAFNLGQNLSQNGNAVAFNEEIFKAIDAKVLEALNRHYTYLSTKSKLAKDRIIKNYAITALYNIIRNPINLREAQSSVDNSTKKAKELAANSQKVETQKIATPGNVFNKVQLINENMVGKDGIGISATGLKTFFAATNTINTTLQNNPQDASKLIRAITIGGKTYNGLANINTDVQRILLTNSNKQLEDYLLQQVWESDASNELSSFLSLSTDNAKDLALSKLNAGTSTLGMYLYGLSLGVPVETLYKIMTSPLAIRLAELTRGDAFNGNSGTGNILGAISYLHKDPVDLLNRYNRINLTQYKGLNQPYTYLWDLINKEAQDEDIDITKSNILSQLASKPGIIDILENHLRNKVNELSPLITDAKTFNTYKALYDQALDFIEQYIRDVQLWKYSGNYSTVYGEHNIATDLETLAYGAEEFKRAGQILRLNQEIKTNSSELIQQVSKIEQLIVNRLNQLNGAKYRKSGYINRLGIKIGDYDLKNPDSHRLDLHRFLTDPVYQKDAIEFYDSIMQTINPLRIITTSPQYLGYVQSLDIVNQGLLHKQMKYRLATEVAQSFISKYKVRTQQLQRQVYKHADAYVDYYLRQSWMQGIKITIPGSNRNQTNYAFLTGINTPTILYFDKTIQLGTDVGDANFKLWMEQSIIPKLKADLPDNKFVQALGPVIQTNTNLGMPSINYSLVGINMLPQTDVEREYFDNYKDAFNQLSKYPTIKNGNKSWRIQDLLYLYSLVSTNGKLGPTSLHKIFEDFQDSNLALSYKQFIAEKETDNNFYEELKDSLTDTWLAPFSSPFAGNSNLFKYKDANQEQVFLYRKEEKSDNYEDMDYSYELDDMGFYGDEDSMANVNGYVREESQALSSRDVKYFSNPVVINNNQKVQTFKSEDEFFKDYSISWEYRNGKPILVDIRKNSTVVNDYIKFCKKERKGSLPTIKLFDDNGKIVDVISEQQLKYELENIENPCE